MGLDTQLLQLDSEIARLQGRIETEIDPQKRLPHAQKLAEFLKKRGERLNELQLDAKSRLKN